MLKQCWVVWMISVGVMAFGAGQVSGQTYPNRPIRIITSEAGGGVDVSARLIAQGISGPLGQPVIVENRPPAFVGDIVAKATADGYTITSVAGVLWITPELQKTTYDPVRDFSPITLAYITPLLLVVHPSVAANSVKDVIALAKAKPGGLNYSSGPTGGESHLAGELFNSMAGVKIARIPYKGSPLALNALVGGEVQMAFGPVTPAMPQVKAGKLRALAVTSAAPSALAPGMPTLAASGLPGYEVVSIGGMLAPAGTPSVIVNRLNQEIVRFLTTPDVKEKYFNIGGEVVASSPAQFEAKIASEISKWRKLVKDAGIRAE